MQTASAGGVSHAAGPHSCLSSLWFQPPSSSPGDRWVMATPPPYTHLHPYHTQGKHGQARTSVRGTWKGRLFWQKRKMFVLSLKILSSSEKSQGRQEAARSRLVKPPKHASSSLRGRGGEGEGLSPRLLGGCKPAHQPPG